MPLALKVSHPKGTIFVDTRPLFRVCKNDLCGKVIWNEQYKYGSGRYCDEYCKSEGVNRSRTRVEKENRLLKSLGLTKVEERDESDYCG